MKNTSLSVFGLGYVGAVTSACFAELGHQVVGVDIDQEKVDLMNSGRSSVIEDGIDDILEDVTKRGMLEATTSISDAVEATDLGIVCVGTPSQANGALDHGIVRSVCEEIGECLKDRDRHFLLVVRSTILPGTVSEQVIPIVEKASGKPLGDGYDIVFHPEFLREGSSIMDFHEPARIIVGERRPGASQPLIDLYPEKNAATVEVTGIEEAEMIKYCDNAFHALKVTFANEIGQFCESKNIDSRVVMKIFCKDRKLNISPNYLMPGFAFGGSCLPKDLRALTASAKSMDVHLPLIESLMPSNAILVEGALKAILQREVKKIGFYGLAFKPGTDDLRESPFVTLAEQLLGKGCSLTIFDERVHVSRLVGKNKSQIEARLPHLSELLTNDSSGLIDCEMVLMCHVPDQETLGLWAEKGLLVLNLTHHSLAGSGVEHLDLMAPGSVIS